MKKNFLSKEEWEQKIHKCLSSGKTIKTWCYENNIPYKTLMGWKTRLNKLEANSSNQTFIELKAPAKSNSLVLRYKDIEIKLTADFDATLLRNCLDVLRGHLC